MSHTVGTAGNSVSPGAGAPVSQAGDAAGKAVSGAGKTVGGVVDGLPGH